MNGKGDKPRPIADREEFNKRFDNIDWDSKKDTKTPLLDEVMERTTKPIVRMLSDKLDQEIQEELHKKLDKQS
jgi:hypothetical protein